MYYKSDIFELTQLIPIQDKYLYFLKVWYILMFKDLIQIVNTSVFFLVNVLFPFRNMSSVYISKHVYVCWYLAQNSYSWFFMRSWNCPLFKLKVFIVFFVKTKKTILSTYFKGSIWLYSSDSPTLAQQSHLGRLCVCLCVCLCLSTKTLAS